MGLQIVLPINKGRLQMRIGIVATEYPNARIADPPGSVAAQLAFDQMGRLLRCFLMPVEIEVQQAAGMFETCGDQLFAAIWMTQYQGSGDRAD